MDNIDKNRVQALRDVINHQVNKYIVQMIACAISLASFTFIIGYYIGKASL